MSIELSIYNHLHGELLRCSRDENALRVNLSTGLAEIVRL